jgi:hypothetical protein
MPTIQLTDAEANLLKEILETNLSDLRMEVAATDLSFRDKLKEKEAVIKRLMERLGSSQSYLAS